MIVAINKLAYNTIKDLFFKKKQLVSKLLKKGRNRIPLEREVLPLGTRVSRPSSVRVHGRCDVSIRRWSQTAPETVSASIIQYIDELAQGQIPVARLTNPETKTKNGSEKKVMKMKMNANIANNPYRSVQMMNF